MAHKKEDDFEQLFWTMVFSFGGLWLLDKILSTPTGKPAAIGGLPYVRDAFQLKDKASGELIFQTALRKFETNQIGDLVRMIDKARQTDILGMPFYKTLKGTPVTGEFRDRHFRIFVQQLGKNDFLVLHPFIKKTDETPKNELKKAEQILCNWQAGKYITV